MSKMDARVVRDLSESKKRVMANVVQHLQQRQEKICKTLAIWCFGYDFKCLHRAVYISAI